MSGAAAGESTWTSFRIDGGGGRGGFLLALVGGNSRAKGRDRKDRSMQTRI